jgi:hypothetical protein
MIHVFIFFLIDRSQSPNSLPRKLSNTVSSQDSFPLLSKKSKKGPILIQKLNSTTSSRGK